MKKSSMSVEVLRQLQTTLEKECITIGQVQRKNGTINIYLINSRQEVQKQEYVAGRTTRK